LASDTFVDVRNTGVPVESEEVFLKATALRVTASGYGEAAWVEQR